VVFTKKKKVIALKKNLRFDFAKRAAAAALIAASIALTGATQAFASLRPQDSAWAKVFLSKWTEYSKLLSSRGMSGGNLTTREFATMMMELGGLKSLFDVPGIDLNKLDEPITLGQVLAVFAEVFEIPVDTNATRTTFVNNGSIPSNLVPFIATLQKIGVIQGTEIAPGRFVLNFNAPVTAEGFVGLFNGMTETVSVLQTNLERSQAPRPAGNANRDANNSDSSDGSDFPFEPLPVPEGPFVPAPGEGGDEGDGEKTTGLPISRAIGSLPGGFGTLPLSEGSNLRFGSNGALPRI